MMIPDSGVSTCNGDNLRAVPFCSVLVFSSMMVSMVCITFFRAEECRHKLSR